MLATQRAAEFELEPQQENETDDAFCYRISGELRNKGCIIEAHEVHQDVLYDESPDAMISIFGAVAQTMQGVDYGCRGAHQVGDDIAAGYVALDDTPKMTPETALMMIALERGTFEIAHCRGCRDNHGYIRVANGPNDDRWEPCCAIPDGYEVVANELVPIVPDDADVIA